MGSGHTPRFIMPDNSFVQVSTNACFLPRATSARRFRDLSMTLRKLRSTSPRHTHPGQSDNLPPLVTSHVLQYGIQECEQLDQSDLGHTHGTSKQRDEGRGHVYGHVRDPSTKGWLEICCSCTRSNSCLNTPTVSCRPVVHDADQLRPLVSETSYQIMYATRGLTRWPMTCKC